MLDRVTAAIAQYDMLRGGESLLCCLSGGADSVALLICLQELGYPLAACHVNHNLRGAESDRDEQFCRRLCESYGVPLTVHSVDVKSYAAEHRLGTEQAARELRYRLFEQTDCDKICTAHTLSDCAETLIFNLSRGTGTRGLASIPPVRGRIIRPLIECSRAEVEQFLKARGQDWVTDSTNLSDDYDRNRIRHGIVPRLAELNPGFEKTLRGTLRNLREDSALLIRLADELFEDCRRGEGLDAERLAAADPALSGRAILRLCREAGHDCSRETAIAIRGLCREGGKLTLGHGLYAAAKDGTLAIVREVPDEPPAELAVRGSGEYLFLGRRVRLRTGGKAGFDANLYRKLTNFALDYDKIKGGVVIRNRRPGDRIALANRGFTSDLRKLMQPMPRRERSRVVLLADDDGLIAAEGFGIADRVKVTAQTKTVLFCEIS